MKKPRRPTWTIQTFPLWFPGESGMLLIIALQRGRVVGTITLKQVLSPAGPALNDQPIRTSQFVRLFVNRDFRRRGVATTLIMSAEAQAIQHSAKVISCYVKPFNREAMKFYKACGYHLAAIFDDGDLLYSKTL